MAEFRIAQQVEDVLAVVFRPAEAEQMLRQPVAPEDIALDGGHHHRVRQRFGPAAKALDQQRQLAPAAAIALIGSGALRGAGTTKIPLLINGGMNILNILISSVLIYGIFSWPGLGRWLIDALQRRDYPVVQGGGLLVATMIILVNLLVDLLYGVVNPRIRHKK